MIALLGWPSPGTGQTLTINDVLAGYKQNYASFETLRVSWVQFQLKTPGWYEVQEAHRAKLEQAATRPELTAARKAEVRTQLAAQRTMLADPANKVKRYTAQDFWTDRHRFQVRTQPRDHQPGKEPGDERFRFPDEAPDTQGLLTTYQHMSILSFQGDLSKGFRVWEGRKRRDSHAAVVHAKFQTPKAFPFPPLGGDNKLWGAYWHAIDAFFALPAEQLTVTGTETVDGRKTHVVSHLLVNKDASRFLAASFAKKYQGSLHKIDLTRAWVDASSGCLPVKMEWESYYVLTEDGKAYSTRSRPFLTLEVKAIEHIENGGWYPTKGLLKRWGTARKQGDPPDPAFDDLVREKGNKYRWVLTEEDGWDAYLVEAGRKMPPTLFALEFPKNTVYYDQLRQKGMSTSNTQEIIENALKQVTPSRTKIPRAGPARHNTILVALNVVAFAAVVGLYVLLRRRAWRSKA
jgi:hypothetical protein